MSSIGERRWASGSRWRPDAVREPAVPRRVYPRWNVFLAFVPIPALALIRWLPPGLQRLALDAETALTLGAVAAGVIATWRLAQRQHRAALTEADGGAR